jgi:DNA-binding Lrp family transcriptional regulator
MTAPAALDRFDLAILDILQTDNTTPQRVIAQAVNLSAPAVQRRIQRLQNTGVIRANVAVLDPEKVGKPLTIVVEVHLENERPDRTAPLRAHRRRRGRTAVLQRDGRGGLPAGGDGGIDDRLPGADAAPV